MKVLNYYDEVHATYFESYPEEEEIEFMDPVQDEKKVVEKMVPIEQTVPIEETIPI